jgi:hypothetical protein
MCLDMDVLFSVASCSAHVCRKQRQAGAHAGRKTHGSCPCVIGMMSMHVHRPQRHYAHGPRTTWHHRPRGHVLTTSWLGAAQDLCRTALAGAACAFGLLVLFLLDHALNIETIRFAGVLPQLVSRAILYMLTLLLTLLSGYGQGMSWVCLALKVCVPGWVTCVASGRGAAQGPGMA